MTAPKHLTASGGAEASSVGRFLRLPEVKRETGLSRPTIYRQIKAGKFPRPRRIGLQAVAWRACDIEQWKRERLPADFSNRT